MAVSRRKSDFVTKKKTRRKTTAANAKKAPQNTKSSPNKKKEISQTKTRIRTQKAESHGTGDNRRPSAHQEA